MSLTEQVLQEVKRGRFGAAGEEWEQKSKSLVVLQAIFLDAARDADPHAVDECFNLETWRALRLPLQGALKDLRSQIVKEACGLVTAVAEACNLDQGLPRTHVARDGGRPLLRDVAPTLLELLSSGNKVNVRFVDDCVQSVISKCRFKQVVQLVGEYSCTPRGKSAAVRECCAAYAKQIVEVWGPSYLNRHHADLLQPLHTAIEKLLEDSSEKARAVARDAFVVFAQHWPDRGEAIAEAVEPRAARWLREQMAEIQEAPPRPPPTDPTETKRQRASPQKSARRRKSPAPLRAEAARLATAPPPAPAEEAPPDLDVGARVLVHKSKLATVKFLGQTHFSAGFWIGVELDAPRDGAHDGVVAHKRYFETAAHQGLFVRPSQVEALTADELASPELARACVLACEHKRMLGGMLDELQAQLAKLHAHEAQRLTAESAAAYAADVESAAPKLHALLDEHLRRLDGLRQNP
ncbi:hypothetical protein M885DRAFT_464382 [Pelagophyceae sp. CCMP2097]|nr:hypothetical protein M885DRAFT_464382 [Pelagophyceae sp. CCMP2097]|mmetsp:Transcript_28732/g.96812  ORF Transcript_28732/g.96812 Transcript_28732/m.96812 type:complete len:466 (-) Transcript_28732:25-1422(-)